MPTLPGPGTCTYQAALSLLPRTGQEGSCSGCGDLDFSKSLTHLGVLLGAEELWGLSEIILPSPHQDLPDLTSSLNSYSQLYLPSTILQPQQPHSNLRAFALAMIFYGILSPQIFA